MKTALAATALLTLGYGVSVAAVVPENELQKESPTIIYGASETAPGVSDAVEVIQKAGAPNPLGNPIINTEESQVPAASGDDLIDENKVDFDDSDYQQNNTPKTFQINETSRQNPSIQDEPNPADMNNKIQNTMYESGGRIYDIQSYPDADVQKMESPEQPTIDNYPAY